MICMKSIGLIQQLRHHLPSISNYFNVGLRNAPKTAANSHGFTLFCLITHAHTPHIQFLTAKNNK